MRLGIVVTHPVQYQAPWFRALAAHPGIDLEVLFGHRVTPREQAEAGFGVEFEWDEPLLEGYSWRFLRNTASRPSVNRFTGVDSPDIAEVLQQSRFDAVAVSGWHSQLYIRAIHACLRQGIPLLVRSDSHSRASGGGWRRTVKSMLYRPLFRRFDACLAVGSWSREYFLECGVRQDRVFIVPHMVSSRFAPLGRPRGGPATFLFAGKLTEWKRPFDFLEALRLAIAQGASVNGMVAGDGPLRAACEAFVRRHGLPVVFSGFLNQSLMLEAYGEASALVVPSRETWGLVVNEAMACGLPVFVSDAVGSHPDLVQEGRNGFVYPHENAAALASKIAAIHDVETLAQLGESAWRRQASVRLRAVEGVLEALDRIRTAKVRGTRGPASLPHAPILTPGPHTRQAASGEGDLK